MRFIQVFSVSVGFGTDEEIDIGISAVDRRLYFIRTVCVHGWCLFCLFLYCIQYIRIVPSHLNLIRCYIRFKAKKSFIR